MSRQLTKEQRLAFILRKTISDMVKKEVDSERGDIFADLMEKYTEDGVKQVVIKLPDGEAVATLTIAQPTAKTQFKDMEALEAWVAETDPDAIETVTTTRISPVKLAELQKHTTVVDGKHFTEDGEEVPGMVTTTAAPTSFSVKYTGGDAAREKLLAAWKQGELAGIDTGKTVPQLGWHGQVEEEAA